ncbi:efflux RND transporter periplasmic adaptor subunit [Clostridiaceae bacterium 35-E11]
MKKKFIWIGAVVLSLLLIIYLLGNMNKEIQVELFQVTRGAVSKYIEEVATIKSENTRKIYAKNSGTASKIMVAVGEQVEKGELLAVIDGDSLYKERDALEAEKMALSAQYDERMEKLETEEKKALIQWEEAKRKEASAKKLYEEGVISEDAYKKALAERKLQEANVESIQKNLQAWTKGTRNSIKKQQEAQRREIQSQMDILDEKIADLSITAPIDGKIFTKYIEEGSYIQPGMEIIEIGDANQLYMESEILVSEVGNIQEGDEVKITNEDLDIESLRGTVRKIHPRAFTKMSDLGIEQKRVIVEIDFEQGTAKLKPGYDMDIKILTNRMEDVLFIPEDAIFDYHEDTYVFINENGIAKLRKIQKGMEGIDNVEIKKGLIEGDMVILSPNEDLKEGMKVNQRVQ